ncbi:MAG: ABC transporter ATP-binding protein [Rhizobiaceae bacterium]|nr:MAG: ABC transporter ATP-binding protein [Rhizobiaceae bacterium]CAG0986524.1 Dipeptide transport ATP-binding protein DppD [Rhizobiaceae bacterium]
MTSSTHAGGGAEVAGSEPLLNVVGLQTQIRSDRGTITPVDGVSFHIKAGEIVALVGESGCGKSMTALSTMRLVSSPVSVTGGQVVFEGTDLLGLSDRQMRRMRGGRLAMIFQDPMTFLNPLMKVADQIVEAILLHQPVKRREAEKLAVEALRRVRIPAPESVAERFPHQLSGGMRQRVLIAIAITSNPSLLIADEPTTALDVTVQAQIMHLLADIRRTAGTAMLFITHDLGLVAEYCDRVYVMYSGRVVEEGSVFDIFAKPRHPYTRALLRSTLSPGTKADDFVSIQGHPPAAFDRIAGCRFHPRCPSVLDRCRTEEPPTRRDAAGAAACWLEGAA